MNEMVTDKPIKTTWKSYLYVSVFCVAIALLIYTLEGGGTIWQNLAISFAIGWSITTAFFLLELPLSKFLSPYVAPIPITAIGLVVGLMIGGLLVSGRPLLFFSDDYSSLALGIFFGAVGFVIFATRGRLQATEAALERSHAEQARQEQAIAETELKLLQAQIEPHFLFNTLSNVVGLIDNNPSDAKATLLNLTTLLRSSLNRTRAQTTTLAQEFEIARAYLEIHKTRMHDRLTYSISDVSEFAQTPLPPLLVQPLIENAIAHGIEPKEEGGHIDISVTAAQDTLQIDVKDNGMGFATFETKDAKRSQSGGTGLSNVRKRVKSMFKEHGALEIRPNTDGGVTARLTLPRQT